MPSTKSSKEGHGQQGDAVRKKGSLKRTAEGTQDAHPEQTSGAKHSKRKCEEPDLEPGERKKKPRAQPSQETAVDKKTIKGEAVGVVAVSDIPEISEATRKVLEARNITTLFEIQQQAFGPAFSGRDVVGRAKTGCGKTLAFVLPTVERIRAEGLVSRKNSERTPVVVAVAPTRELARQIFGDFDTVGSASGLKACCFYGGTAFGPQCDALRSGVDLLVCTPGRVLDHIRRGTVNLSRCRVLVLDEADEMLSMGFQEDVDAIMEALPKDNVQKLLFSATLPQWVNALVDKHLHDPLWIDVAANDDANATNSKITHKCIACPPSMRGDCIGDLCKVHAGHFGKTLVFTDTKKECDELAINEKLVALGAGVLHGDIGQNQRELVMDGFRSGRIKVLVATSVAARGLDIPNVELVVQTHPPKDLDMYVHRAGRTARGGHEGTCVTFYSKQEEYIIRLLERQKGIRMQRVGPPQPSEVVRAAASDAAKQLDHVHQDSVDAFLEVSRELIAERGAEVVLAAALAALTGHARRLRGRSLLSSFEGFTAMVFESDRGIPTTSKGWYLLRQMIGEDVTEKCKAVTCCKDGVSVIFDVPDELVPRVLGSNLWKGCKIEVATSLPELCERDGDYGDKQRTQQDWWRTPQHGGRGSTGRGGGRGYGYGSDSGAGRGSSTRGGGGGSRGSGRGRR